MGKLHLKNLLSCIRKLVGHCDNLSLFEILNSYSGGTGSGMTSLLLEHLSDEYAKKYRFETGIFPSTTLSESTVGPYNALLYTHTTFENLDCGILVDNESIYNKLCNLLQCHKPTFTIINRFLVQMISCIFLSHRYNCPGSQHMDVDELMTNAIPYPRIHFPVLAYAPIINSSQANHEVTNPEELTRQIFQTNSHFLNCPMQMTKYISCCLLFRGLISPQDVFNAVSIVKSDYRVQFVDWCPTGFKIGINNQPSLSPTNNILAATDQTLCMISGNVGIKEAWRTLRQKYDILVSKKSFIHWFIGEGLEESDFSEANEDILILEKDYEEIAQDSESSQEVEITTVKTSKVANKNNASTRNNYPPNFKKFNENTNNICSRKSVANVKTYNPNYRPPQTMLPYSKLLYEDIVEKIDTKLYSSNKKMLKKLNKLQMRLNQMNRFCSEKSGSIILNSKLIDKSSKSLITDRSTILDQTDLDRSVTPESNDGSLLPTPLSIPLPLPLPGSVDYMTLKAILQKQILKNLDFSSREQIVCSPTAMAKTVKLKKRPTSWKSVTEDVVHSKSITSRITSDSFRD